MSTPEAQEPEDRPRTWGELKNLLNRKLADDTLIAYIDVHGGEYISVRLTRRGSHVPLAEITSGW